MVEERTVLIGDSEWLVSLMVSTAELTAGLSGIASIPANTGMLFDMGSDQDYISINMADMLFSLDIVFINSEHGVVGVLRDVEPGELAAFEAGAGYGARYFMEVNAGEAVNVNVGDTVNIGGGVQPSFWAGLLAAIPALVMVMTAAGSVYKDIKGAK